MKINTHILSQLIAEKDNGFINLHEVEYIKGNIEVTYDVVVPAKQIIISEAEYRQYLRGFKIDSVFDEK